MKVVRRISTLDYAPEFCAPCTERVIGRVPSLGAFEVLCDSCKARIRESVERFVDAVAEERRKEEQRKVERCRSKQKRYASAPCATATAPRKTSRRNPSPSSRGAESK